MQKDSFKEAYKERLLETYDFITKFLDDHKLKWWGGYGTCLGAVRHKGLIPWDDDIDLCMPRNDYELLIGMRDEVMKNGYDLFSSRNGMSYNTFLKISNLSTSLIAESNDPFDTGVFVDVFPLDHFNGNKTQFLRLYKRFRFWSRLYRFVCMKSTFKELFHNFAGTTQFSESIKSFIRFLTPGFLKSFSLNKINSMEDIFMDETEGDYMASFCSLYASKDLYPKKWFDGFEILEYEGRTIKVPREYESYLRWIYGDFMKYPDVIPESTHSQFYVNLKERLSKKEINNKVKNGIHKEW